MPRELPRDGQSLNDSEGLGKLTDKEMEILRILTRGMTSKAIGKALFISSKTVRGYKTRIMNKLGAESLVDLVDFARRCRLVP
ncbi:helix-turn-helix domain-containing protein [Cupriavidus pauculus]|uniref:helix-turn-helix domain-containing protein n=1 Tax=Cupriavidus pauculus TaxID=82633 RepID=UPI0026797EAF